MKKFLSVVLVLWGGLGIGNWILSGCPIYASSYGLGQMVGMMICGLLLIIGLAGLMSKK